MSTSDNPGIISLDSDGNIIQPKISRGRPKGYSPKHKRVEQDDIDEAIYEEYNKDPLSVGRDLSKTTTVHKSWLLSRDSVRRLEQLKFDPILRMVQQYERLEEDLHNLTHNPDGTYREKYSHLAYSSISLVMQKITNDLIRYGYARVTETVNVNAPNPGPMQIILTEKYENGDVADDIDVTEEES